MNKSQQQESQAQELAALKQEVADIKNALRTLFDHRDMPWEIRREWSSISRVWFPVGAPVEPPAPPPVPEESLIDISRRTLQELKAIEEQRVENTKAIEQKYAAISAAKQAVLESRRKAQVAIDEAKAAEDALRDARDVQILRS